MKFSKTFGAFYDYFMYLLEKFFLRRRRVRLLKGLSGKILEVGVGTGANFEHYGNDAVVTGIEPSPHMLPYAIKKKEVLLFPNRFTLLHTGCGYPEMAKMFEPESLDAVVCTLVLCTIPDPQMALDRFMKWLKPGGRLLILEHIRAHNHYAGKIQDALNPVWSRVAEGCQLNRPTDIMLAQSGFRLLRQDRFYIGLPFYEAEYEKPCTEECSNN